MILALSFLPPSRVPEVSDALMSYLPQELVNVLEWFRNFYIED